jgi:hypothetical protein
VPASITKCYHREDNLVPLLPISRLKAAVMIDTAFPDHVFHSQWAEDRVI